MAGTQIRGGLAAIAALSTAAAVHAGPGPTPLYVDASAPVGGNGTSWSQAFRDLQDALALAKNDPNPAKQYDIRVAQGVYTPDRGTGNRAMTFLVASGMTMTGGYGGLAFPFPDIRDTSSFVSVLSGDLGRNDALPFANTSENAYTVVTISAQSPSSPSQISGFTISGGNGVPVNAPGGVSAPASVHATIQGCVIKNNQGFRGGGVASEGWLALRGCRIESNGARQQGGGVYSSSALTIENSVITRNFSELSSGGGVAGSTVLAEDSEFTDNTASTSGGGVSASSQCNLTNCIIAGNSVAMTGSGGGVAASGRLISCLIAHNTAGSGGGVASWGASSSPTFNHCTIVANSSPGYGGAIYMNASGTITNCVVAKNTGAGAIVVASGTLTVHRNLIRGGSAGISPLGSFNYDATNINADPLFVNETGTSSLPNSWRDKDYRLRPASLGVDAADSTNWPGLYDDVAGRWRDIDILVTPNTGTGSRPFLDLGAYETQRACVGDFDGSGQVTIDDLFWFFSLYFAGDPLADVLAWDGVTIDDLFYFLNAWFRGC